MFKRVLLIGSPGSGKSTLAPKLAEQFGLPLFHLDQLNWIDDQETVTKQVFLERLEAVVAGEHWLIDGNYGSSLELRLKRADLVIWMKVPRLVCVYRVIKRYVKGFWQTNVTGNPKRLDWEFLKFVWHFPKSYQATEALLGRYSQVKVCQISKWSDLIQEKLER